MAKKAVGLYIGANLVSIAELKRGRRPQLLRYGLAEIAPKAEGKKEDRVLRAIQKVLDESGIKAKEVTTNLPPEDVTVRYFRMARLPRKEWAQGVRFEAKKYVPFKVEEITSDFKVVETKDAKEMEVIFAAAKKEAVTRHLALLQKVGLRAAAIEPGSFSLMRIFRLAHEIEEGQTITVIDISIEGATINILKDKSLYLARSFTLARAPEEPARPVFENLLSELHLSFDYYRKQFPGQTIAKVILCGEGSFEGWDELLAKELNIPVIIGDFRKGLAKAEKVTADLSSRLAMACGLALRGVIKPIVEVNLLLPKEIVPAAAPLPKEVIRKIASFEIVVCGLILLAIYFGMFTRIAKVRSELDGVKAARPPVKTKLMVDSMSPANLEEAWGGLKQNLTALQTIIDDRVYLTVKLNELARVLPEGTWLTRFSMAERVETPARISRSLTIEGSAFSKDKSEEMGLVNRLVANLKEDEPFFKGFREIELSSIKKAKKGEIEITTFTLTCSGR